MVWPEYGCLSLLKKLCQSMVVRTNKICTVRTDFLLFYFSIFMHTKDYTDLGIHVVRPPVNVELLASISVLIRHLGMCVLALRNGCSLPS
jgi:hypothetical protein